MKKIFVGCDKVEEYICQDEKKIYLDGTLLLSSGARDYLREKGIALIYGKKSETDQDALMCADFEGVEADAESKGIEGDAESKGIEGDAESKGIEGDAESKGTQDDEALITKIVEILKNDYSINDNEKIVAVSSQIMKRIRNSR
ncbi:MAG: hypothetical protein U9N77_05625 [Thermodesulfobacteriota bacterium]|nr:hypothetical protein [Thermodesulfobacteriota bacterium]